MAHLPFLPPPFLHRISHKNIPGDDYYECGTTFLFLLSSLCVRPNVKRLLGLGVELPSFTGIDVPQNYKLL